MTHSTTRAMTQEDRIALMRGDLRLEYRGNSRRPSMVAEVCRDEAAVDNTPFQAAKALLEVQTT